MQGIKQGLRAAGRAKAAAAAAAAARRRPQGFGAEVITFVARRQVHRAPRRQPQRAGEGAPLLGEGWGARRAAAPPANNLITLAGAHVGR